MAAHTIMERDFMRMLYLPGTEGTPHRPGAQSAAVEMQPPGVEEEKLGGKARHFCFAIPLTLFAYPLPIYLEKALPHWRVRYFLSSVYLYTQNISTFCLGILLAETTKKPAHGGLAQKNKFYRHGQARLGCRDTSSSSTTASAGKKPRAKASCGSTQRRFWPSAPQGSPANSVT